MLWLYRVTLDPVWERGRSERARTAAAARDSVFAYRTELRPAHSSSAHWQPAPRLLFHVDRGEHALPAQLGWRGTDGAETAISFQSNMSDFHGCRRDADGSVHEYRGRVVGRWAYPEGVDQVPAESLHRFHTEEGWGGGWHRSHELRLLVDDGGAAPERMTWRDRRGNSGVVVLHTLEDEAEVTEVEASDEHVAAGETARNLLDDSRGKWLAGDDTALLDFTLTRPATVTSYVLVSANDFPDRDPRTGPSTVPTTATPGHRWTPARVRRSTGGTRPGVLPARCPQGPPSPPPGDHPQRRRARNPARPGPLHRGPRGSGLHRLLPAPRRGPHRLPRYPRHRPVPRRPPRRRFPRRLGPGDRRGEPRRDGTDPRRPGGTAAQALTPGPRGVQGRGSKPFRTRVRARSKTASRSIGPGSSAKAAAILGYAPLATRDIR